MPGSWFIEMLGAGLTFRIPAGAPLLLGRDDGCGVILPPGGTGRRYASLRLVGDGVLLRQEADWEPTKLNLAEVSLRETPLYLDDVLKVGEHFLRLVRGCDLTALNLAHEGGQVVKIARILAGERRYDELPVLADALEDAGCGDRVLLSHCREGRPHLRGCCLLEQIVAAAEHPGAADPGGA